MKPLTDAQAEALEDEANRAYGTRRSGTLSEQLHQKRANRRECFVSGYLAAHGVNSAQVVQARPVREDCITTEDVEVMSKGFLGQRGGEQS